MYMQAHTHALGLQCPRIQVQVLLWQNILSQSSCVQRIREDGFICSATILWDYLKVGNSKEILVQ